MITTYKLARTTILGGFTFLIVSFVVLSSCEKRVTPNKLERIVQKDTWRIGSFIFQGQAIEDVYNGKTFEFTENGKVKVLEADTLTQGNYNIWLNKEPTTMYFSGFYDSLYYSLNDDWIVTSVSNSSMEFESQNGPSLHTLRFIKVD